MVEKMKQLSGPLVWNVITSIVSIMGALLVFTWQAAEVKNEFILALKEVQRDVQEVREKNAEQDARLDTGMKLRIENQQQLLVLQERTDRACEDLRRISDRLHLP